MSGKTLIDNLIYYAAAEASSLDSVLIQSIPLLKRLVFKNENHPQQQQWLCSQATDNTQQTMFYNMPTYTYPNTFQQHTGWLTDWLSFHRDGDVIDGIRGDTARE